MLLEKQFLGELAASGNDGVQRLSIMVVPVSGADLSGLEHQHHLRAKLQGGEQLRNLILAGGADDVGYSEEIPLRRRTLRDRRQVERPGVPLDDGIHVAAYPVLDANHDLDRIIAGEAHALRGVAGHRRQYCTAPAGHCQLGIQGPVIK